MSVMQVGKWARGVALPPDWWVPKDGRTLDLDVLNWRMWDAENGARAPNALAISRPSARSRVGPGGLIETVGSGLIARDFTVAGAARGLQIEPQTTNLATYSEDASNAIWSKIATTISANAAVAPDGATAADKIVEDTSTATHYLGRSIACTSGVTYSFSTHLKAAGRNFALMAVTSAFTLAAIKIDLVNRTVSTANGSPLRAFVEDAGNGWVRAGFSAVAASTSNGTFNVYPSIDGLWDNRSYLGDGSSGLYWWGEQIEASAVATSYMPAAASGAVRYADGVSLPFGSWGTQGQGGLYVDCGDLIGTGANNVMVQIDDEIISDRIVIRRAAAGNIEAIVQVGGVAQAVLNLGAHTSGNAVKAAIAWGAGDFAGQMSGGTLKTATPASIPAALTRLHLGGPIISGAMCGHLREVAAYPTRAIATNALIGSLVA